MMEIASHDAQPGAGRDLLIAAILAFLADQDAQALNDIRGALEREIDNAHPKALLGLSARLAADHGWGYYPPDQLARRIHHVLADRFLDRESQVLGAESLDAVMHAPVVIVSNHLSYADANVFEVLLRRAGAAALANRLTALAGPKVFTSQERRFSSLCFGTIKVPQSAEVSSEEAVQNVRDVARAARQSIEAARARLAVSDALLLFGEGTRSRTGAMQPMLAAVARYLEAPDTWVVPAGLAGSETLFPVGGSGLRRGRVVLHVGCPVRAGVLLTRADGDRRLVMDAIGLAVADLLPPAYRGVYGKADDLRAAREVLRDSAPARSPKADG